MHANIIRAKACRLLAFGIDNKYIMIIQFCIEPHIHNTKWEKPGNGTESIENIELGYFIQLLKKIRSIWLNTAHSHCFQFKNTCISFGCAGQLNKNKDNKLLSIFTNLIFIHSAFFVWIIEKKNHFCGHFHKFYSFLFVKWQISRSL